MPGGLGGTPELLPSVRAHLPLLLCPQVMQVLNADAIVVKLNSGDYKTIHLSSIRPPRLEGESTQVGCLSAGDHGPWLWTRGGADPHE